MDNHNTKQEEKTKEQVGRVKDVPHRMRGLDRETLLSRAKDDFEEMQAQGKTPFERFEHLVWKYGKTITKLVFKDREKAMSKEIDKKTEELEELREEYKLARSEWEEKKDSAPSFKRDPLKIDCQQCGVKAGVKCKNLWFGKREGLNCCFDRYDDLEATKEYRDYIKLFTAHQQLENNLYGALVERTKEINKLDDEIKVLEKEEDRKKSVEEFKQNLDKHSLNNSRLTVLTSKGWHGGIVLKVLEARNIMFLVPGDKIPDRECLNLLMKKGIEVTLKSFS